MQTSPPPGHPRPPALDLGQLRLAIVGRRWLAGCRQLLGQGRPWPTKSQVAAYPAIHGHRRSTLASFGWPLLVAGGYVWPGILAFVASPRPTLASFGWPLVVVGEQRRPRVATDWHLAGQGRPKAL